MLFVANQNEQIRALQAQLRRAQAVTPALMASVLALLGERYSAPPYLAKARRVDALFQAEAWTDAALTLLDLALPQWKLRRIVYDDGEWHCCLGKQWPLPEWLDDTVEVGHAVLPLAILDALIEARILALRCAAANTPSVPPVPLPCDTEYMCCDNFA
jgi:hypothetical protein